VVHRRRKPTATPVDGTQQPPEQEPTMTNTWIGLGRLTDDPELRYTQAGKAVADMRIAVPRNGADKVADFFDVVAFDTLAENCAQYCPKGRQLLIEGALRHHTWEDRETGAKRSKVDILANRIQFLALSRQADSSEPAPPADEERL
jgi:single-strand DNA-binding protein